ncbi:MAG TPA: hypothetical protein VFW66_11090 [Gemmatimonadales bacterium]|nr:hypothetical protein [Gemmatimonadales bacterium]
MQNQSGSRTPRRRCPRARADLRFQPAPGGLALRDGQGRRSGPLSLTAALVLTYCDGAHEPSSIAHAVAQTLAPQGESDALRADVQRIIESFETDGLLV